MLILPSGTGFGRISEYLEHKVLSGKEFSKNFLGRVCQLALTGRDVALTGRDDAQMSNQLEHEPKM